MVFSLATHVQEWLQELENVNADSGESDELQEVEEQKVEPALDMSTWRYVCTSTWRLQCLIVLLR